MRKYRQLSYHTLSGVRKFIDPGDFSYGEWIIYEDKIPKYHIRTFDKNPSDKIIDELIASKRESIESIVDKVGNIHNKKLTIGKNRPIIRLVKKSELIELDLIPLPYEWVKQLIQ